MSFKNDSSALFTASHLVTVVLAVGSSMDDEMSNMMYMSSGTGWAVLTSAAQASGSVAPEPPLARLRLEPPIPALGAAALPSAIALGCSCEPHAAVPKAATQSEKIPTAHSSAAGHARTKAPIPRLEKGSGFGALPFCGLSATLEIDGSRDLVRAQ